MTVVQIFVQFSCWMWYALVFLVGLHFMCVLDALVNMCFLLDALNVYLLDAGAASFVGCHSPVSVQHS